MIQTLLDEVVQGKRLSPDEAVRLFESNELARLGQAAHVVCLQKHPEHWRTYNIDRNINYTNVCECRCKFCNFSCDADDPQAYVISMDEMFRKIDETVALGGNQILLQGGLNPALRLEWFENLFRTLRERYPQVNIHGLTPTEIWYLANLEHLPYRTVIERLKAAGLGTLPGGGAEILSDAVRNQVSPKKIPTAQWLEIMELWHTLGGRSSATMMFGHVETFRQRVEHLEALRQLQDRTHGFTAFIPWTYQPSKFLPRPKSGTFDYLKTLAISRLYLDNIPNIQASWVTQGLKIGRLTLQFGANDMGSVMIEENVVASCGTTFRATESQLRQAIQDAGWIPQRRNVFYEITLHP